MYQKRLFTHEQIEKIDQLINDGMVMQISSVISNLTPEQEAEIQNIVDEIVPKEMPDFTSKVEEKWRGVNITSPEQEAQMQKEMEEEFKEWEAQSLKNQLPAETPEEKKAREEKEKENQAKADEKALKEAEKTKIKEEKDAEKAAKEAEKAAKKVKDLEDSNKTNVTNTDLESLNSELDKQ